MNVQANFVVQGFLLALLLPVAGLVLSKINQNETTRKTVQVIDYEPAPTTKSFPAELNQGKNLFLQKCASCHHISKDMTGPALKDFQHRGQWADREKLHEWIKNPALFMKNDLHTQQLKVKYITTMSAFPDISKEEVNAIADFIIWNAEN
jgi:cytochrome c2